MRKSRFGEEQIIRVLREQEAGARTEKFCRRHVTSTTPSTSGRRGTAGWRCPRIEMLDLLWAAVRR